MGTRLHPSRGGPMLRSPRPFSLLTATILALSACGNTGTGNTGAFNPAGTTQPQSTSVAVATPSPQTDADINTAVLEQYKKCQETYRTVYQTGDPAPLADVAVDPVLSSVTKDVLATRAKHEIWRFTTVLNPKVGWK